MIPQVLYKMPQCAGKKFRPSNGTEGMIFTDAFCEHCIHEKFMHTGELGDKQCDIFNRSFLHDLDDPEYPDEFIFNAEGWPVCTNWVKWDWNKDDDNDQWNDPPDPEPYNPNQLVFPFIFDEIWNTEDIKTDADLRKIVDAR